MFEVVDSSGDEAEKENENSLTESEEGDMSRRRYTRNQIQVIESKMPGCLTPEKNRKWEQFTKSRSSPRLSTIEKNNKGKSDSGNLKHDLSSPKAKSQKSSPPRLTAIQSENLQSTSPKRTSPRRQKHISNKTQLSPSMVSGAGHDTRPLGTSPRKQKRHSEGNVSQSQNAPTICGQLLKSDNYAGKRKIVVNPIEMKSKSPNKIKQENGSSSRKRSYQEASGNTSKGRYGANTSSGEWRNVKKESLNTNDIWSHKGMNLYTRLACYSESILSTCIN